MFFKEWEKGYQAMEMEKMRQEDIMCEEMRRREKEEEEEKKRQEKKRKIEVPVKKMPVSRFK